MCAIRQLVAGILVLSYILLKKKPLFSDRRELWTHLILGALVFLGGNGLTTWGIKYIPSGLGALLGCLFPFFLVILNALIYKTSINLKTMLGLLLGFGGVALIFLSMQQNFEAEALITGVLLVLAGVLCWTFGSLISSKQVLKAHLIAGVGWQMLFGGILLFAFSIIAGEERAFASVSWAGWLELAYLILIGSIMCFLCFMYVLRHLPPDISGIYAYINPIIALILGILFLEEPFFWNIVWGTLLTLLGVYIVKRFTTISKTDELE